MLPETFEICMRRNKDMNQAEMTGTSKLTVQLGPTVHDVELAEHGRLPARSSPTRLDNRLVIVSHHGSGGSINDPVMTGDTSNIPTVLQEPAPVYGRSWV